MPIKYTVRANGVNNELESLKLRSEASSIPCPKPTENPEAAKTDARAIGGIVRGRVQISSKN
jgi:hypothetical protein